MPDTPLDLASYRKLAEEAAMACRIRALATPATQGVE